MVQETIDDVPKQAITMTVLQIMQSKVIVSWTLQGEGRCGEDNSENEVTCEIPAQC